MAIDSRQKRMSVAGCGRPYMRAHHTGTINQAWRIAAGNAYSGNTLVSVVISDNRTASGRIILAITSGDKFRLRAIRTDGSDDLQTIDEGSAMTGVVFRN